MSASQDLGKSRHGIPDVVMAQIDRYVDSLRPQIEPLIAREIDTFQRATVDGLDEQVIAAFRGLFNKPPSGSSRDGPGVPSGMPTAGARSIDDRPPDFYGGRALPFANELATFAKSIQDAMDDADDDLGQIFSLTGSGSQIQQGGQQGQSRAAVDGAGNGSAFGKGARGFLSAALEAVSDVAGAAGSGQPARFGGILDVLSDAVKDASCDPEQKARILIPDVREKVGAMLRQQHAPIPGRFTDIALEHLKRWLRGNTSTRDLGDGLKGEISSLVSGLSGMFSKSSGGGGSKDRSASHATDGDPAEGGQGDSGGGKGGFSGVISDKLSTGLARVHRDVRVDFRKALGQIEKQLFEALPDEIQGPLEKVLGGNPFDPSLGPGGPGSGNNSAGSRGLGDDIKAKLIDSLRRLIRRLQQALQAAITSIVAGGHRKLEGATWRYVQQEVESKVRKFLPKVRITVPDDIGNEGVSVGELQGQPDLPPASAHAPSSGAGKPQQTQTAGVPDQQHQPFPHPGPQHDAFSQPGGAATPGQQPGYPSQHVPYQPTPPQYGYPAGGPPPNAAGFPTPQVQQQYPQNQYQQHPPPPPPPLPGQQQQEQQHQQPQSYHDGIVATQKFRSSRTGPGRRQDQQGAVVDDWEADSDDGLSGSQAHDPFRASKDEWNQANNQAPMPMPVINDHGRTLPPTAYGSGLASNPGGGSGGGASTGFPQPQLGTYGGGPGPAPPRILQRPRDVPAGVGMGGSSSGSSTPPERKTVEQRQEEYRLARARIFGDESR
ncbi:uncharacterized protein PFL1_05007 [Pseudozyma flocculosa PF-1]|uniref:SUZ domain-containing protein n=2 Tax=Pseudozyma flocculosa TaxID=84751 RepID=A0A5C3EW54_9BASI|nr:uncharacterized protein PFL1_05007 [Pseudozyma flocculosa PF-1]EPQ27469.1 hypothetical protein PFL1_05007 [Pseudozyma flocculosa PF-1]SPO36100.1 uncharacterized protein PSFLO_01571 [Pseudozyma flocculosa]